MDLSFSEEQLLIKESVEKFIEKDYDFDARNKLLEVEERFSRNNWKSFAELGWLGVALPEEFGGFDGGPVETMLVMEAFGSGMVLEPYISSVVLSGSIINLGGSAAQKKALLPPLIEGDLLLATAFTEKEPTYAPATVNVKAEKQSDNYIINGEKAVVLDAPSADKLIVSARTAGEATDPSGISLLLVDVNAPGITLTPYNTMDGARAANITFTNVQVSASDLIGEAGDGYETLSRAIELTTAALCAHAVGMMQSAYQATLDYIKTREQFGVPIGKFQVLQHRLVDMYMALEQARSMVYMVSIDVASSDALTRQKAVSGAKAYVGKCARLIAQDSVQIHGGVGMTEELNVGHYFRNLTLFCNALGSTDYHLKRYAELTK
ncbi:MAG: acyl-CoA dehydrogenase family protein [Gammaproteobacteria bacterium]|nr:acyl-CoA dehydrogenase family protein [Gammaproteobacteria bacterium]